MEKETDLDLLPDALSAIGKLVECCGDNFVLVGAAARDAILQLNGLKAVRATRDIDFGVCVPDWSAFGKVKQQLFSAGFAATHIEFRLKFGLATIDIIPF